MATNKITGIRFGEIEAGKMVLSGEWSAECSRLTLGGIKTFEELSYIMSQLRGTNFDFGANVGEGVGEPEKKAEAAPVKLTSVPHESPRAGEPTVAVESAGVAPPGTDLQPKESPLLPPSILTVNIAPEVTVNATIPIQKIQFGPEEVGFFGRATKLAQVIEKLQAMGAKTYDDVLSMVQEVKGAEICPILNRVGNLPERLRSACGAAGIPGAI